jgi:hypothetical protein
MLLMALTGLTFALLTQHVRREHDRALPRRSRRPALPPVRPTPESTQLHAPAQLAALGYLPPRTGVVAGLHVQEILTSPAGKELRARPIKFGNFELRLDSLRDWIGLDVEDVDYVVLGVVLGDQGEADLTPPTHLVVRTRRPFSPNQVRAALKAGQAREVKAPGGDKRTLYSAKVRGLPMTLWLPDHSTIVLGLASELEDVPARASEGIDHLGAELRLLIEKRLSPGMVLWAAGHADDWKKTWLPTLLAPFRAVPVLGRLEQVKSFAIGLIPDNPIKLQGAFRCAGDAQAKQIEEQELVPRSKKEPEKFKYSRDGAWLDVQWKFDGTLPRNEER